MFGRSELLLMGGLLVVCLVLPRRLKRMEDEVDEGALGEQALEALREQTRVSPLDDPLPGRILGEFRRLRRLRIGAYRFYRSEQEGVNAMALPGGIAVLTTGLLEQVAAGELSEDELAAVLAHEIAHIELGHGRAAAVRQTLSGWAGRALAARALGPMGQVLLPAGVKTLSRSATRAAELAADAWAFELLGRSRYDRAALATMLRKLAKWDRRHGLWSTHPAPAARIAALTELGGET